MAGTFPLRVADLFFTDEELVIAEYAYLTPLFGLAGGNATQASASAAARFREGGVPAVCDAAERVHRQSYRELDRVRIYDGGSAGRPKVAVDVSAGPPYAYRIHAPVDLDALTEPLVALGDDRSFDVSRRNGLGFSPGASLRRFLADR